MRKCMNAEDGRYSANKSLRRLRLAPRWVLALFLFCVLLLWLPNPAAAQPSTESFSYWQYAASGRLQQIVPFDVDQDGVSEFLVADENGRVDLLNSTGSRQWSFSVAEPVLALNAFVAPPDATSIDPTTRIVVGIRNYLILLDDQGNELWRRRITPVMTPLSLYTAGGKEQESDWLSSYQFRPDTIATFDWENDGQPEILTLLESGNLLLYDSSGRLVWHFEGTQSTGKPHLLVADVDRDGRDEIARSIFGPRRFSEVAFIDTNGEQWELPISGRITALTSVTFRENGPAYLAIGTGLGHVYLYNSNRERIWFRTINKPVSALAAIPVTGGKALAVGSNAGAVVAFDELGRRLWSTNLNDTGDRRVLALSASSFLPPTNQPGIAALLEMDDGNAAEAVLLDSAGELYTRVPDVDLLGLTQVIDSNGDGNNELLLARFATLELLGLGMGNSEYIQEWEYGLNAAPSAMLAVDLDGDRKKEIVIGTQDGRIHSLDGERRIRWLHDVGGAISFLDVLPDLGEGSPGVVVVRNLMQTDPRSDVFAWVELREAKGERIWERPVESPITTLHIGNVSSSRGPEIIIGTERGDVIAFNSNGERTLAYRIEGQDVAVQQLLVRERRELPAEIIAATQKHVFALEPVSPESINIYNIANYEESINHLYEIEQPINEAVRLGLLVLLSDGTVHGLNGRGAEIDFWPWPQKLGSIPLLSLPSGQMPTSALQESPSSFLLATNEGDLLRLDIEENRPRFPWRLSSFDEITSLYWGDEDRNSQPDIVMVGNSEGKVWLYTEADTNEPLLAFAPLKLSSAVFGLSALRREVSQSPDVLAITENGLVQLFREQENRPPLVTDPNVVAERGQYSISVNVEDVEGDDVTVQLELQDPETGEWLPQEAQRLANGVGTLFWPVVSPPPSPEGLNYRFAYDDGFYRAYVQPEPGPPPAAASPLPDVVTPLLAAFGILGLIGAGIYLRQSQTPNARARRFYYQLKQQPVAILTALEARYAQTQASPDFLLYLANQARQAHDMVIANLADGLFLLPDRPQAGLSIITRTLDDMQGLEPVWQGAGRWQMTYKTGLALLEAPTITELTLLRPQLLQLLAIRDTEHAFSPALAALRPILTNLRDSERVDLAEDRLVYLNEAAVLIRQTQQQLQEFPAAIERTMVKSILRRWSGLVSAEIDELRGRAELVVTLKTKRVVPHRNTEVALEIRNNGRSAAENVIAILDQNPAYKVLSSPQVIPLLPPGRTREVRFTLAPQVIDRFRLGLTITYDDRNQEDKTTAFGDMVYLLPPVRNFQPIDNPYTPGTPLRRDSLLFYGREELFEFIAENAGAKAHRNVLILVGQRRTGKTSFLLRLQEQVPPHLLPVYVDCQSLGVTPGMPALLQEFAWHIADALSLRGIEVEVPELEEWQEDATGLFQRHFLPQVKALLPPETVILLVFDEFEAFENLVEDGILPRTFFTYLRHLMQHVDQLNFIFVGTRKLEEMSSNYWSVLFNIALYRKIGYLSREAAVRLITEPVAPNIIYDDLALDKIWRVTAGHPYFLQLVCYSLVKRANAQGGGYVTISDVNAAVEEMLTLGEVHFAYLWQRSSHTERALLTAVAHLMDRNVPFHPEELLQYLEPYDIHLGAAEVTRALTRLVERDIMREVTEEAITHYELQLGLVGLWVAQNKSLSKLYASNGAGEGQGVLKEALAIKKGNGR